MTRKNEGFILWLTGLSGAGKSMIAKGLEGELKERGLLVEVLDDGAVRKTFSKGLGFSREDRDTYVRRIGFVANQISQNGAAVIVASISPYRDVRNELKKTTANFIEVYVNAPLEVCEMRDVKGLYAMARVGEIQAFTGIDAPYEEPLNPDIVCYTAEEIVEKSISKVAAFLQEHDWIGKKPQLEYVI